MLCPACARNLPVPLERCPYCGVVLRSSLDDPLPEQPGLTELRASFARIVAMQEELGREITAFAASLGEIAPGAAVPPLTPASSAAPSAPHPPVDAVLAVAPAPVEPEFEFAQAAPATPAEAPEFAFAEAAPDIPAAEPVFTFAEAAPAQESAPDPAQVLAPDPGQPDFAFEEEVRAEQGGSAARTASFRLSGGFDEAGFGRKWLLILGLVAMIFGVGYFLKYSFERDWVGPLGRVVAVAAWGGAFLCGGEYFRRRDLARFASYLSGGGLAVLYFAVYAGFGLYDVFSQSVGLALLGAVTLAGAWMSLRDEARPLAGLTLAGGLLSPVLVDLQHGGPHGLLAYLSILDLGVLLLCWRRRWSFLAWMALFGTSALFYAWFNSEYESWFFTSALAYVNVLHAVFFLLPLALRRAGGEPGDALDHYLAPLASAGAMATSYGLIAGQYDPAWAGAVSLGYAAMYGLAALYLRRASATLSGDGTPGRTTPAMYAAGCGVFLILSVPIIFDGYVITICWSLMGLGVIRAGLSARRKNMLKLGMALLGLSACLLAVNDYPDRFGFSFWSWRFREGWTHDLLMRMADVAAYLLALGAGGWMVRRGQAEAGRSGGYGRTLGVWFGISLFVLLTFEVSGAFRELAREAAPTALSVAWGLFAAGLLALGFRKVDKPMRKAAITLFVLTVAKIFFVDTSGLNTLYRVISFTVLGLILVAASFLYHRFKDRIGGGSPDA